MTMIVIFFRGQDIQGLQGKKKDRKMAVYSYAPVPKNEENQANFFLIERKKSLVSRGCSASILWMSGDSVDLKNASICE